MLVFKFMPSGWAGPFLFHHLKQVKLNVFSGAPLSSAFHDKPLVPIVFSHGLTASANQYSRILSDLARHGYLVFGIDHLDGSCLHTVNAAGEDVYHGVRIYELEERPLREKQLKRREEEITALIEEISSD